MLLTMSDETVMQKTTEERGCNSESIPLYSSRNKLTEENNEKETFITDAGIGNWAES